MKIAIIGTVGIPAKYGGFETLAQNLVSELNERYSFIVYCSSAQYKDDKRKSYLGAKLKYVPVNANGKSSIIYDFLSIVHALFYADVLLILGVSGAFMIPIVKLLTKKKIITNIDGLEWKRDKWGGFAKRYLKKQEQIAVRNSHEVVVDNKGIENHVAQEYGSPSTLIAYGGDHVSSEKLTNETKMEYGLPSKFAFKVCRIEPENNIHVILKAFAASNENIVIVGNWQNSAYGTALREEYSKLDNIYLLSPIYNQKVLNELRSNCFLYVHGHSAGGTNPSLVEAMHLELPILAFDVHYNRFTTDDKALYFNSSEGIVNMLNDGGLNVKRLKSIALDMKSIAMEKYTWKGISKRYEALFQ